VVQRPPLPYRPFVRREHLPDCVLDAQPARRVPSSAVGFAAFIPGFPDGEGFSVTVAWTACPVPATHGAPPAKLSR
jgi:hypothetical protein